jgi:predicted RNA binding protein YcfA (HicA-like mRNA interferase family)
MRIPRDVAAGDLVKALARFGYRVTRQKGSHIRLTTDQGGEHHEVVPNHDPVKIGTLSSVLKSVAEHHRITVDELLHELNL